MANTAVPALIQTQPRAAITHRFTIALGGAIQRLPWLVVEPGLAVTLQAASGNAANISAGTKQELIDGTALTIAAGKSIGMAVDSVGQIYVQGTALDKLTVLVSGVPIG